MKAKLLLPVDTPHIADLSSALVATDVDTAAEIATQLNATNLVVDTILVILETHRLVDSA
jgi:hypothetical protein